MEKLLLAFFPRQGISDSEDAESNLGLLCVDVVVDKGGMSRVVLRCLR